MQLVDAPLLFAQNLSCPVPTLFARRHRAMLSWYHTAPCTTSCYMFQTCHSESSCSYHHMVAPLHIFQQLALFFVPCLKPSQTHQLCTSLLLPIQAVCQPSLFLLLKMYLLPVALSSFWNLASQTRRPQCA